VPDAATRRLLIDLTLVLVMAALFCVSQIALGKALDPSKTASGDLWLPQPKRVWVELVRIPGSG